MAGVKIVNLVKKFGTMQAVKNLTLEIEDGDFVVLLGPSGCGKTTTLRCIAGLEDPDSGQIFIGDTMVNDVSPKDRDIAMVFQNYALYPHMSVYDNIAFPLVTRKVPKHQIELRVQRVSEMLNISELLQRRPGQLSGGQQQRVALARAIIRQPRVFLMDEPLSNLDAKLRLSTRAELKRLKHELKITTIFVTHDQAEAMSMSDKIAIMNGGELVQYADPVTIYNKPASTFVGAFVGSPPMNLITGAVMDNGATLETVGFKYKLTTADAANIKKAGATKVVLGVRPEKLQLSTTAISEAIFESEVYVVEPLGSNTLVDVKVKEDIFKAVVDAEFRAEAGQKVWVKFDDRDVHIFDASTGLAIV